MKSLSQREAVQLRRDGVTYREIQGRLGITKSTLWRWLKAEGLVDGQSQQYTERRLVAQKKAAEPVRRHRLHRTQLMMEEAYQEVGVLTSRELKLIGTALYWAEGSKQNTSTRISEQVVFSNTDPRMLRLFVDFLNRCYAIQPDDLRFRIYLHETADAETARQYWFSRLGMSAIQAAPITWKRHKPTVFRSNVGSGYYGLLRIIVPRSTNLNRRITGWINGMVHAIGE
ncbi:MAG: helix-turn-helix domain-containing protein [Candidatus Omnitrophica bacterium]|nr:helix-turn-helix domain-containing protein [Candidatus Omnitrophota bacterium]